jgi:pantoate kinase
MKKLELNLHSITTIKSLGSTGIFLNDEFFDELDINNFEEIIEYLDNNEYQYFVEFPYLAQKDMPDDEWIITLTNNE